MPENYRDYPQDRRRSEGGNRYGRQYRGGRQEDRGLMDRTGDEIRSWFGDDEAERRRRLDEQEDNWREDREDYRESARRYRGESEGYGGNREFGGGSEREYGRQSHGWDRGSGDRGLGRRSESRRYFGGQERGYGANASYSSGQNPDQFYDQWENQGGSYGRESQGGDWENSRQNLGNRYERGFERGSGASSYEGPFRGRGPSGWRRSDERITENINERLEDHGQIDADGISVTVNEGEVTLSGTVNSKTEKRLAELVAESCSGVKDVQNQLRVKRDQNQFGSQSNQSAQWRQSDQSSQSHQGDQGTQTSQSGKEGSTRSRSTSI